MNTQSKKDFLYFYERAKRNESVKSLELKTEKYLISIFYCKPFMNIDAYITTYEINFQIEITQDEFVSNCATLDDFFRFVKKKILSINNVFY